MITPAYSVTATERVLPRMALDFTTAALDSRVTVTRALNTATCFNASGFIETVNANLPRFDYNSLTLQCKGLLIEEARSNLFLYSNQFDQFPWSVGDATISVDTNISPLGVQNADTLVEAANNSVHFVYAISASQPAGTYTYSIYVKPNGRTKFRLQQNDTTAFAVLFDLTAQTVTSIAGGATGRIEPVKNGWFRCSMTYVTAVPITLTNVLYLADSSGSISYLGDGVSGVHVSAAQLELGAFATSYIPTTTTSLTRNADVVSMTGTNFSDWYNATRGTFFVQYSNGVANNFVLSVVNSSTPTTEVMYIRYLAGQQQAFVVTGGSTVANIFDGTGLNAVSNVKTVISYQTDSYGIRTNGGASSTAAANDASGAVPSGVNKLNIGANQTGTGAFLNQCVAKLFYYDVAMLNAQLAATSK